jgi:outer membrane receptor protein involved in Fe transport
MFISVRFALLLSSSAIALMAVSAAALAQAPAPETPPPATPPQTTPPPAATPPATTPPSGATIPQITVTAPKQAPRRAAAPKPATRPAAVTTRAPAPAPAQTAAQAQAAANQQVVQRTQNLDQRRDDVIEPKAGASQTTLTQQDLQNLPQGANIQISDLVLQFPGVAQDSTSQGDFHIRNEHANVQYRINGILLPDGVSGFQQFLETSFIDHMSLITGILPAQYGFHTSGILDITTKSGAALAGGNVSAYGGSRSAFTNAFEYGGVVGQTDYFFTGRYNTTGLGLENPISDPNAIHDQSEQGKVFGYTSTLLGPNTRLSSIIGVSEGRFQIPDNPGQMQTGPAGNGFGSINSVYGIPGANLSSANINQNQYEKNAYAVLAWQRSVGDVDAQLSYFSRYSDVHFVPDPINDLYFNNVASDIYRSTFVNGIAGDGAYRVTEVHTFRAGFTVSGEETSIKSAYLVDGISTTPDAMGNLDPIDAPFTIGDQSNLFGWQMGAYAQDEWKLTNQLTLYSGLRFDQIFQYVDANQLSPRVNLTYQPWWATLFHAGFGRYFTPPPQDLGRVFPTQLFDGSGTINGMPYSGTTNSAAYNGTATNSGSILPERSSVYDAGVVQQLLPQCPSGIGGMFTKAPVATINCPSLEVSVDGYYKKAQDLLDDGQFGQAYVLTAFNYTEGENWGVETKAKFRDGNFTAYVNFARANQIATRVASNQSLWATDELAYANTHWISTDHSQQMTGSAGVSYLWTGFNPWIDGTKISGTMIYGTGLRQGFANTDHLPSYTQFNAGVSREFSPWTGWGINDKPLTVRFDVVNLFDTIYEIRSGSGIGIFAPQYGPRRGYFVGISQKL